jgi:hypothetical protein
MGDAKQPPDAQRVEEFGKSGCDGGNSPASWHLRANLICPIDPCASARGNRMWGAGVLPSGGADNDYPVEIQAAEA